ncbi:hypothetical protein [Shewanella glacialipiscicola]
MVGPLQLRITTMFSYIICYDLYEGKKRYRDLWRFLIALGAQRDQRSVWTLQTDLFDLESLRCCFTYVMSEKDKIQVHAVSCK